MTTIYAVSRGSYSDYGIVAMFSTKETAEQFAALLNKHDDYDEAGVEEWPLDAIKPDGRVPFLCWSKDRSVEMKSVSVMTHSTDDWRDQARVDCMRTWHDEIALRTYVLATDEEHATKVAADRFREHVALHGWEPVA